MTQTSSTGSLFFTDKEFSIKSLEQAFGKSPEVYIEPGKAFSADKFDQADLPQAWHAKYKVPVVTMHEGKYVFIVLPEAFEALFVTNADGVIVNEKGFKAKFVSKYNFNQAKKTNEVAAVPPPPPKPVAPAYADKKPPQWNTNNGFQKDRPGGYNRPKY